MALSYDERLGLGAGIAQGLEKAMNNISAIKQKQTEQKQKDELFKLDTQQKKLAIDKARLINAATPIQLKLETEKLGVAIKAQKAVTKKTQVDTDIALDKEERIAEQHRQGLQIWDQSMQNELAPGTTMTRKIGDLTIKRESDKNIDIASAEGLTLEQQLEAREIAIKYGKRKGMVEQTLPIVHGLMKQGKTRDDIEDHLRLSKQSKDFPVQMRNAVERVMTGVGEKGTQKELDIVDNLESSGDVVGAKEQIKKLARQQAPSAERSEINGKHRTVAFLDEIQSDLNKLESSGIDTNIFSGTLEDFNKKLGRVKDPEARKIAIKIQTAIQKYRKSVTGAAFNALEAEEYNDIFPSIKKTAEFNTVSVQALKEVFSGDLDNFYRLSMGDKEYNDLFGSDADQGAEPTLEEYQAELERRRGANA